MDQNDIIPIKKKEFEQWIEAEIENMYLKSKLEEFNKNDKDNKDNKDNKKNDNEVYESILKKYIKNSTEQRKDMNELELKMIKKYKDKKINEKELCNILLKLCLFDWTSRRNLMQTTFNKEDIDTVINENKQNKK
jgi:hypothetical protein